MREKLADIFVFVTLAMIIASVILMCLNNIIGLYLVVASLYVILFSCIADDILCYIQEKKQKGANGND